MLTFDVSFHPDGVLGCVLWADETVMGRVRFDIGSRILQDVHGGRPVMASPLERRPPRECARAQLRLCAGPRPRALPLRSRTRRGLRRLSTQRKSS
jgi:hypothetical protein